MAVVGFSGSYRKHGNIEVLLTEILLAAGGGELIRLAEQNLSPCTGCLKCAASNRCILKDSGNYLLEKVLSAEAVIIGAYPTFMSTNALTKLFLERLYPLKHRFMLTKGKLAAGVSVGFRDAALVDQYLKNFFQWFQMEPVGSLVVEGNMPCLFCGVEEDCSYSNIRRKYGAAARPVPEMAAKIEEVPAALLEARQIGHQILAALAKKKDMAANEN